MELRRRIGLAIRGYFEELLRQRWHNDRFLCMTGYSAGVHWAKIHCRPGGEHILTIACNQDNIRVYRLLPSGQQLNTNGTICCESQPAMDAALARVEAVIIRHMELWDEWWSERSDSGAIYRSDAAGAPT